jgi:hypothetical protein
MKLSVLPFTGFQASIIELEVDVGVKMSEDRFPAVGLPDSAGRKSGIAKDKCRS